MEFNPHFNQETDNIDTLYESDEQKLLEEIKRSDKGYNLLWRLTPRQNGKMKRSRVEVYTTCGNGSQIRDAETGEYYLTIVGTKDEDLFFKVTLSTGECKSKNGSNVLFFTSPTNYISHMKCGEIEPSIVRKWENKRNARLNELNRRTIY